MAYQARQRGPLLDGYWQEVLERRSRELLGVAMIASGLAAAAMLFSYSAQDPGLYSATPMPVRNWLGSAGAAIASPLMVSIGYGSWCLAAFLLAWGFRFAIHAERGLFLKRLMFLPAAMALGSVFAAAFDSIPSWEHHFGLGGLFGDSVLAAVVYAWPTLAGSGTAPIFWTLGVSLGIAAFFALGFVPKDLLFAFRRREPESGGASEENGFDSGRRRRVRVEEPAEEDWGQDDELQQAEPARGGLFGRVFRRNESEDAQDGALPRGSAPPVEDDDAPPQRSQGFLDRLFAPVARVQTSEADEELRPPTPRETGADRRPFSAEPPLKREPQLTRSAARTAESDPGPEEFQPAAPDSGQDYDEVVAVPAKARATRGAPAEPEPTIYEPPSLDLLQSPARSERQVQSPEALQENARALECVLDDYGVKGTIDSVRPGPVVTLYELAPAPGLKASRVVGLSDDIARSMSALSARISTVPGRSVIGIELPNVKRESVYLKELVASEEFNSSRLNLPIALGKDIGGESIVVDLATMPHLLIAGTTGSGKSVAINTMILSLLFRLSPEECRLIMIDPKMLELSVYDGIPHLLAPVVTDPKKAVVALKWVVAEMEERYRQMSTMSVRNIHSYNSRIKEAIKANKKFARTVQTGFDEETGEPIYESQEYEPVALPFIVVIVDEMADLMMVAGKEIEACIQRLAQMARASGIHIVMATQRPSVDVITGTIKANFPCRVSFQVTSKVDSRTILGEQGAEQLLGKGDMLYLSGGGKINRVHGPFVSDEEVEEVVRRLKELGEPEYVPEVLDGPEGESAAALNEVLGLGGGSSDDAQYDMAVSIVLKDRKCSTSYIQRKLGIGYNKAAKLVEQMEENGLISPANHVGKREILVPE